MSRDLTEVTQLVLQLGSEHSWSGSRVSALNHCAVNSVNDNYNDDFIFIEYFLCESISPGIVCLILTTTLQGRYNYYYPQLADKKTEAHTGEAKS